MGRKSTVPPELSGENNYIFIGKKPLMNYVNSVVMQFTQSGAQNVVIKARGKFIGGAVDVAQVSMNNFLDAKVTVKDIRISSEDFKNNEGKKVRVSSIEIELEKVGEIKPK